MMSRYTYPCILSFNELQMSIMKYFYCVVLWMACLVLLPSQCDAQDVQFSQPFTVAQYLNPGLTGNFDGRYRIMTVYRDQGRNILGQPLVSYGFGGDVKFDIGSPVAGGGDLFGVGVFFLSDQAPTFEFNTNAISLNLAYHKKLSRRSQDFLSLGLQFGVQQRNINYDNLDFPDEFNQVDEFNQQTQEGLPPNNFGYADVGLGLTYSTQPSTSLKMFMGAALHHFNTPNLSFFSFSEDPDPQTQVDFSLNAKFTAHISADYNLTDFTSLLPRLIYISQGDYQQVNVGTYIKFDFIQSRTALYTGLWLRMVGNVDGMQPRFLIPNIGFELGDFLLGVSYDVNTLNTFGTNNGANTLELSVRFLGSFENDDYFCPQF